MAEHPNAALIRAGLEAFNRQDYESFMDILADDIVWHTIGPAAPIRGKAAMVEGMSGEARDWTVTADIHDVTASDDHVIALVRAHAERGGGTLDYNTAEIFHVKDGQVTERWAFSDDTARINEFFA